MYSKTTKLIIAIVWFLVVILGILYTPSSAWATDIDGTDKWAWSTNAGWLNFKDDHGWVSVYADHLEGYVWAENVGWIRLGAYTGGGSHTYANTTNTDYGVNRDATTGKLSGYGWATNAGRINFMPTHGGGVVMDLTTGDFSGYAWAENVGWIKLKGTAINSTAYKVKMTNCTLTVTDGTGGGVYLPGTEVNIASNAPSVNQVFDKWTGDTANIANIYMPNTIITIPFANTTVITATYKAQGTDTYALTVTGGVGGGRYLPGTVVNIAGNAPEAGHVFDVWTGSTAYIANINLSNTILIMPSSDAAVTATYKVQGATSYTLTVNSGTGDGTYLPGSVVNIAADIAPENQVFDKWVGQTANVANINLPNTNIYMPFSSVTVIATYKTRGAAIYTLTVTNGTGGGTYSPGTVVSIAANAAPANQVFDKWVGQTANIANINLPNTTIHIPFSSVTVIATYKAQGTATYTLTVTTGTGGGTYSPGSVVNIAATAAPASYVFDQWVGQTAHIANINMPNTILQMPFSDIAVTATYKPQGATTYTLTVNSGTGGGAYLPGTVINIVANTAPSGYVFDKWVGQTEPPIGNIYLPNTVIVMPFTNTEITATYRDQGATLYSLTLDDQVFK